MKRVVFGFILSLCFLNSFAQEKLGIANSNYSSTNSIYLNPSSSVDSRTYIQANLLGLNIYAMNSGAYVPQFSLWSAVKGDIQDPQVNTFPLNKFVYARVGLDGPAVVVSNREIGIGIFVRARVEVDVRNIPDELTSLVKNQQIDTSLKHFSINASNMKVSEMTWVEYGFNFGKMFFKHGNVIMSAGGNAKYITGINVAYFNFANLKANVDITAKQAEIQKLNATLAYNIPAWNAGQGGGADLGFTYKKTIKYVENYYANSEKYNCKFLDYRYKLGLSLLDLGVIRFSNNAYRADIAAAANIDLNNLKKVNNTDSLSSFLNGTFITHEQKNSPIWASLPTALSFQADWNMSYYMGLKKDFHFYLNTTAIQALTTARVIGVQRSNLVSVAPRFEIKSFEIAMPLTFQRYIYPQLGLAFRIKHFVLGFDNILPFVLRNNTYGMNIYFNIGISFDNKRCRVSRPRFNAPKIFAGYTFNVARQKQSKDSRSVEQTKMGERPSSKIDNKERTKSIRKQSKESKKKRKFRLFRNAPEKM